MKLSFMFKTDETYMFSYSLTDSKIGSIVEIRKDIPKTGVPDGTVVGILYFMGTHDIVAPSEIYDKFLEWSKNGIHLG